MSKFPGIELMSETCQFFGRIPDTTDPYDIDSRIVSYCFAYLTSEQRREAMEHCDICLASEELGFGCQAGRIMSMSSIDREKEGDN